jgi:hypothetical protein
MYADVAFADPAPILNVVRSRAHNYFEEVIVMKRTELTLPEVGLLAATRAMLGAGIGLLLANRLSDKKRKVVGGTLFAIGVLTTIPLAADVLSKAR